MTIDIGYPDFEKDCEEIFKPFLYNFGFVEMKHRSTDGEYTKYYISMNWILEISMLSEFPHVGVGFVFCSPEMEYTRRSILEKLIDVNRLEETALYKKFDTGTNLNDYRMQMFFVIEILNMSYQKVLMGAVTFKDYQKFAVKMKASEES